MHAELLLLEPGSEGEAEVDLWKAMELARSRKAKSLELRAATTVARVLRRQRRTAEARVLLAECYEWFTEGFQTADLRDARELMALRGSDSDHTSAVRGPQGTPYTMLPTSERRYHTAPQSVP